MKVVKKPIVSECEAVTRMILQAALAPTAQSFVSPSVLLRSLLYRGFQRTTWQLQTALNEMESLLEVAVLIEERTRELAGRSSGGSCWEVRRLQPPSQLHSFLGISSYGLVSSPSPLGSAACATQVLY